MPYRTPATQDFVRTRTEIDSATGCWRWVNALDRCGYALLGPA